MGRDTRIGQRARWGFGQMKETANKKWTATDDEVNAIYWLYCIDHRSKYRRRGVVDNTVHFIITPLIDSASGQRMAVKVDMINEVSVMSPNVDARIKGIASIFSYLAWKLGAVAIWNQYESL